MIGRNVRIAVAHHSPNSASEQRLCLAPVCVGRSQAPRPNLGRLVESACAMVSPRTENCAGRDRKERRFYLMERPGTLEFDRYWLRFVVIDPCAKPRVLPSRKCGFRHQIAKTTIDPQIQLHRARYK